MRDSTVATYLVSMTNVYDEFSSDNGSKNVSAQDRQLEGDTELHKILALPKLNGRKVRDILEKDPDAARTISSENGLYPIHILAQNTCQSKMHDDVVDVAIKLILAHPQALALKNPEQPAYTSLVILKPVFDWIASKKKKNFLLTQSATNVNDSMKENLAAFWATVRKKTSPHKVVEPASGFLDEVIVNELNSDHEGEMIFSELMLNLAEEIPVDIVWVFDVLSFVIEIGHRMMKNYSLLENAYEEIIDQLASYRGFVRTFLVMDGTNSKAQVYSSTLMKLVMLNPKSIPRSLVNILANKDILGAKGIIYLEELSNLMSSSIGGLLTVQTRSDVRKKLTKQQRQMFSAIEGNPEILSAANDLDQNCHNLRIIQKIIDRSFRSLLFPQLMLFFDVLFNLILVVTFHTMVWSALVSNETLKYDVATQFTIMATMYFYVRETFEALAFSSSFQMFCDNVFTFGNFIDYGAIILTIITSFLIQVQEAKERSDGSLSEPITLLRIERLLVAGAVFFQSLKLMKVLRMFNEDFAVFIMSVQRIFVDIKWFMVVLIVVTTTFATIFVYTHDNPAAVCDTALFKDITKCEPLQQFLGTYELMLGDWGRFHQLDENGENYFLFVAYTVIVTIVLLNILIAIASQAFEATQESGPQVFRKERLDMAAELRIMQKWLACTHGGAILLLIEAIILLGICTITSFILYVDWDEAQRVKVHVVSVIISFIALISTFVALSSASRFENEHVDNTECGVAPPRKRLVSSLMKKLWGKIEQNDEDKNMKSEDSTLKVMKTQRKLLQSQQEQILEMQSQLKLLQATCQQQVTQEQFLQLQDLLKKEM